MFLHLLSLNWKNFHNAPNYRLFEKSVMTMFTATISLVTLSCIHSDLHVVCCKIQWVTILFG